MFVQVAVSNCNMSMYTYLTLKVFSKSFIMFLYNCGHNYSERSPIGGFRIHLKASLISEEARLTISGFNATKCKVPPAPTDFKYMFCKTEKYIAL